MVQEETEGQTYLHFVGIDCGSEKHQVTVVDADGKRRVERVVDNMPNALGDMSQWLLDHCGVQAAGIAVAIENPRGPVVELLLERGFPVYWLNPKQLDRFRDRHTVAGAKDDKLDAYVLADALRTDQSKFRQATLDDPAIIQIRELSRMYDEIGVDLRRAFSRLLAQLARYYPQIGALSPNPDDRWILDLVEMAPTPERARRLSHNKVEALLQRHRIRRLSAEEVLEILRSPAFHVAPGTVDAASRHVLVLVAQAQLLFEQWKQTDKDIDTLIHDLSGEESEEGNKREHPDAEIILSVPGCGNHLVATVLAEASQALAERNYKMLRASAGVAPVTKRSGKAQLIHMRYACNNRLRKALYHAAGSHARYDPKAKMLYASLRARGHNHHRALRGVGDRLLKLIIAMLEHGNLYDRTRRLAPPTQQLKEAA